MSPGILAAVPVFALVLALPLCGCGLVLGIEELSAEQGAGWSRRLGETGAQAVEDLVLTADGTLVISGAYQGTLDLDGKVLPEAEAQAFLAGLDARNGAHRWATAVPALDQPAPPALRIAADGAEIVVAAGFSGRISVGNKLLQGNGVDVLVARFDAGGQALAAEQLGGAGEQQALDVAAQSGAIVLAGDFRDIMSLGGAPTVGFGGEDAFAAKLGADASHLWHQTFGSTSDDRATRVAVGPDGEVALAGTAAGEVIFGGSVAFGRALFVAMLGDDGTPAWIQRFGAEGDHLAGIAVGPAGNVILAGHFSGTLDLDEPLTSDGDADIFVIKFSAQGDLHWSRAFGGPGTQRCAGLHLDGDGNITLTGDFSGEIGFDGDTLVSEGGADLFVARLDPNGQHLWSDAFGGAGDQRGRAIAADPAGGVFLAGQFQDEIDLGHDVLQSRSSEDIFVAKIAPPDQ